MTEARRVGARPQPGHGRPVASALVRTTSARPFPWPRRAIAAAVLGGLGLLGAVGCSAEAPERDRIAESLEASGLPKAAAECTADALVDSLSDEELARIVERGGGGAPTDDPARTDDTADQLRDAMNGCRALVTPTTTAVPTTVAPDGATTTAPDDGGSSGAVDGAVDGAGGGDGAVSGDGASLDPTPTTQP